MFVRRFLETSPARQESHRAPIRVDQKVYEIPSSDGLRTYGVTLDPLFCPCEDFRYRGQERPCKHVVRARKQRAAELAEAA